jgi:hypothetical protein
MVAAAVLLSCSVASPATEVKEALGRAAPIELAAGDARITLPRAAFADVVVSVDRGRALIVAAVEADGRVHARAREIDLGYVGREAFAMERCAGRGWCPDGPALPALAAVVEALLAAPRPDGRRPLRWQIRVERDRAVAGEDAEIDGGGRVARGVFALARDGERWTVASGP